MNLTKYEELLDEAEKEDIVVMDTSLFSGTRIKGLYRDKYIALSDDIETETEKACVLAEELGHYYTAAGDILDQTDIAKRKVEMYGRIHAYNRQVGLLGIVDAYKHHCQSLSETAEYLGVTEGFLNETLTYYKSKYGVYTTIDNYAIIFEPAIAVVELI